MNNLDLEKIEIPVEINPFEGDDFKTYWYNVFKETGNKDFIQRLYNIGKITKEDYIKIVGEEPQEKESPKGVLIDIKRRQMEQDLNILDQDLRVLQIESIMPENYSLKTNDIEPNSTSYKLLKRIVKENNYKSKEEIISSINLYFSGNRITEDEKEELIELVNNR